MQPLVNATFGGRNDDGVRYDFEGGWQCRIYVLADDLLRLQTSLHALNDRLSQEGRSSAPMAIF